MRGRATTMLPREHGAYAQLAVPLVTALAAWRPASSGVCFALASCALFVAHEPALVLLGHRGTRARRESSAAARRWLISSAGAGLALTALAVVCSPSSVVWALLPAVLGLGAGALVIARRERSLPGEATACSALVSAAVPVAMAGGARWQDALAVALAFWIAFLLPTIEVRAIARRGESRTARVVAWCAVPAVLSVLAATRLALALAPLPVVAVTASLVLRSPSAKALRRVGWALAASSVLAAVVMVVALRVGHPALPSTLGAASTGAYTTR